MCILPGCQFTRAIPRFTPQPAVKVAPETPIAEKKEELGKPAWNPQWDVLVEKELPSELLTTRVAHAVRPFCPRFNSMSEVDKRTFWAYFFQALAGAEAGLVPTTNVRHTDPEVAVEDTVTRRIVRQEGLLQLTYMDSDRYGCAFDWQADKKLPEKDPTRTILRPENNLRCGVNILANQVIAQRKPLMSPTSYWSTLRPGTLSYKVFAKQMANVPQVCTVAPTDVAETNTPAAVDQASSAKGDSTPAVAMNIWPTWMK
jgi:hypothetical protein